MLQARLAPSTTLASCLRFSPGGKIVALDIFMLVESDAPLLLVPQKL